MKKHGIAKLGQILGNLNAGHLKDYKYERQRPAPWSVRENGKWIIKNVRIIDVKQGIIRPETALLIQGKRISRLLTKTENDDRLTLEQVDDVIDGKEQYLIPGLSDLHCHLSLISEYEFSLKSLYYFDAQREKNCEFALSKGCTFVRDSAGAYDMVHALKQEIEAGRLLGPKIFPSYKIMTPQGGMWDVNKIVNNIAPMIFGGKVISYPKNKSEIAAHIKHVVDMGAESIKIYLEEKPLYGGKEDQAYNMFTNEEIRFIRNQADKYGKVVESHAMFISGARRAIQGRIDSIAHMTVDAPYTLEDAKNMVENNVAIIPTLSIGSYLAMNCGKAGSPDHPEYKFYRKMLEKYVKPNLCKATIPEIRHCYTKFYDFIWNKIENRSMPGIGHVYPDRIHGFGIQAPKSFENFKTAKTKVGMGTDGGTGITFSGSFEIEFEGYKRYGYSPAEILRKATLENMEILGLDHELGSLESGKYADMVLLGKNPLEDITAIHDIKKVFKDGRCYIDNE